MTTGHTCSSKTPHCKIPIFYYFYYFLFIFLREEKLGISEKKGILKHAFHLFSPLSKRQRQKQTRKHQSKHPRHVLYYSKLIIFIY